MLNRTSSCDKLACCMHPTRSDNKTQARISRSLKKSGLPAEPRRCVRPLRPGLIGTQIYALLSGG
jgi:hypothetical protein